MLGLFESTKAVATERLDTRVPQHVRITNGRLEEHPNSPSPLVAQGMLDPSTMRFLKTDKSYQRPLEDRADIYAGLSRGVFFPQIEIGVRSQDFRSEGDTFVLSGDIYIIDGWQRVGNALRFLDQNPGRLVRIPALAHFGTDPEFEADRFDALNFFRRKISPNLRLANMRGKNAAIGTLYGMSNNTTFPLCEKVTWGQNMRRGELITGLVVCKSAMFLHAHLKANYGVSPEALARSLSTISDRASLGLLRRNVETFFSVVNDCWPFHEIQFKATATQIKGAFLFELAHLFSRHIDYWANNGRLLVVPTEDRRKLSKLGLRDPLIVSLAGSGGAARSQLYQILLDHMNKGRRKENHLRPREEAPSK